MEAAAPSLPCKVCGETAVLFDVCDFANFCFRPATGPAELAGVAVWYYRCAACGFLFTPLADGWSADDFIARIYTNDYARFDPEIAEDRPRANAALIARLFDAHRGSLRILDFGGASGALRDFLRADGFADVASYDPFAGDGGSLPPGPFDLVTCFEVLEHASEPQAMAAALARLAAGDGLILFSTLIQPPDIDIQRLRWWYAAPRNGHISLHTSKSLKALWASAGLSFASFGNSLHLAYRRLPPFAAGLIAR